MCRIDSRFGEGDADRTKKNAGVVMDPSHREVSSFS
jgi:hypothetical protein